MTCPKPAIYQLSGLITEDDMLPMGHCQVLPPLCPIQAERAVVGSQQGLPCGPIGTVTTGQETHVSFHTNCSSTPSRPEQLWNNPEGSSLTKHGLDKVWSSEEPPWTCLAPKFLWQHASGGCGWRWMVARVRHTRPAIALCRMPSGESASTSCLIPIGVGPGYH